MGLFDLSLAFCQLVLGNEEHKELFELPDEEQMVLSSI